MNDRSNVVYAAMFAMQVASICYDDCAQDGLFASEDDGADAENGKSDEIG